MYYASVCTVLWRVSVHTHNLCTWTIVLHVHTIIILYCKVCLFSFYGLILLVILSYHMILCTVSPSIMTLFYTHHRSKLLDQATTCTHNTHTHTHTHTRTHTIHQVIIFWMVSHLYNTRIILMYIYMHTPVFSVCEWLCVSACTFSLVFVYGSTCTHVFCSCM